MLRVGARKHFLIGIFAKLRNRKECVCVSNLKQQSQQTASELSEAGPEGREGMHHWICTVHSSTVVKHECSVHVSSHIPLVVL